MMGAQEGSCCNDRAGSHVDHELGKSEADVEVKEEDDAEVVDLDILGELEASDDGEEGEEGEGGETRD